jgi:hypothetical protein
MLETVVVSVVLSFFLLVWFKTNAFAEYMLLFGFRRFFKMSAYKELHDNGYDGTYLDFLFEYYKNYFVVRLVSCPVCVSFWMGVFVFIFNRNTYDILAAPLILFFYLTYNKLL